MTTPQRWPGAPEIPTVAGSGLPNYEVSGWFGLLAPASTPPSVLGAQPVANTPEAFAKLIQADVAKWRDVVKSTGVKLD